MQRELSRRNRATGCGGHGNRYPLSGKIRCGECGKSFVRRTKTRKAGDSYRRWCCFTATNEGLRHTDGAGNVIGRSGGRQIRDDIAMDLLRRSVNAVTLDKKAITSNLACIVESVLASGEDSGEQELRRLHDPKYAVYLIQKERQNIGYLTIHRGDVVTLQSLYIVSEWQRQGIGRCAVDFLAAY